MTSSPLFQIGSITKVWTLVVQLVNEGLLDLDRPVRDVLPDFRLADEGAAAVATARRMLTHTAGFEGDRVVEPTPATWCSAGSWKCCAPGLSAAMPEPQVTPPDFGFGGRQGLGWMPLDHDNRVTGMGHTGLTMGYQSVLRVIPDAGVAVAVLTNGGRAVPVVQEIYDHVLGELVGVELPRFPALPAAPVPVDVEKVVGTYRTGHVDMHVTRSAGGWVRYEPRNRVAEALMADEEREYTGLWT